MAMEVPCFRAAPWTGGELGSSAGVEDGRSFAYVKP